MKKLILVMLAIVMLSGCMGTKEYYDAQTAYYAAQAQASIAHMQAMENQKPLAEMIAPDGTRFTVNQTGSIAAPVIRTPDNPIVSSLKTIVNSTPLAIVAGGWSAKQIIKTATGDVNASGSASVSTTANSNNPSEIRNADGNISEDNSITTDSNDNNSVVTDSHDAVADPTIVMQPAP